jgi:hypothetical protein
MAVNATENPLEAINEQTLNLVNQRLANGEEQTIRLKTASDRQQRQASALANLRRTDASSNILTPEQQHTIDSTYDSVVRQNIEETARTSVEREAVDRINDAMTEGDPTEAKLINKLTFGTGSAFKVYHDEATKNLLMSQKVEQYETENGEASWARKALNLVTGFIPLNNNFANTGVVANTPSNLKSWLLSGTARQTQGDALWNNYTPDQLAKALADGGELDTALRSAGTTLGSFDGSTSADILKGFQAQSSSDKLWSNVWSVADPAFVLPWGKVASVPKALVRLGARKAATKVATDAVEAAIRVGAEDGAALTGVKASEAVGHLETSAMAPNANTANSVPLAVDVSARAERNRAIIDELGGDIQQVSRATDPAEVAAAIEYKMNRIKERYGSRVKDVEFHIEDVPTGKLTPYKIGGDLPEQGNSLVRMRVTMGKRGGGGFATPASAISNGLTKLGLVGTVTRVEGKEVAQTAAEAGFTQRAFHGTSRSFDNFEEKFAGSATGAENTVIKGKATTQFWDLDHARKNFPGRDASEELNPETFATGLKAAAKKAIADGGEVYVHKGGKRIKLDAELKDSKGGYWGVGNALFPEPGKREGFEIVGKKSADTGVVFLTDDADVGHSYARKAASADNHRTFKEAEEAFKADPSDANADRFEAEMEKIMDDAGQNIRPMDLDTRNFAVHDMKGAAYNGPTTQAIIDKAKADGKDGVVFRNYDDDIINGKVSTTFAVFKYDKMRSAFEGPVIKQDVSGQYFATADVHVPLEGFTTTPLNTPDNGFFRFGRSTARRLDRNAQQKAVAAGLSSTQLQDKIARRTREVLKGLSAKDHGNLDAIMRAGQNKNVWLDEGQMDIAWERLTGEPTAPASVKNAYQAYQDINDIDFFARRNEIYRRDANAGRENAKVHLGKTGNVFDGTATISDSAELPVGRIFNATDHVQYNKSSPLSASDWERMRSEGYVLVTTKEAVEFPDGLRLQQIIAKGSNVERSTLKLEKGLGYKAGGHRAYTGNYFIKQAANGVQPDNGAEYLLSPHVWRTGNNKNRLIDWSRRWNTALADARRGITDPMHYEDNVFANMDGLSFPSGEEFVEGVKSGRITTKYEAEVVGDREMPTAYHSERDDIDRFLDEEELGEGGYYRTTGRMYTSARGNALLDESGEFAETVDPWEMTDRAISNIARMSSFSNYKDNLLERFKATYGNDLKLRQLEDATPFDLMKAEVRDHVPDAIKKRIEAEQIGFSHIMNHETSWEKAVRSRTRATAEWILGESRGGARELGHDFVYWLSKNNPVNFLRGLAFDAKLGMFNVGQLFLQMSTMAVSTALSPKAGLKGMLGALPMKAFMHSKGSEAVLDVLAKRGAWKAASFESEQEFKDFARFMYKSNLLDVGSTHLSINDLRPNRHFGAASKVEAVREHGRVFFYTAEVMNRSVAGRIAWEELKEQGVKLGSAEFRERFVGLADDYSMNMTSESSASFQKGLWSIPTQFWGYNVRMMDAMFGSRFTKAQRTRLILSQFGLFGAGGVPVLDAVDEYVRNQSGASADAGTLQSLISRGALDNAIAAVSGADVRVGERIGSGTFLTDLVKKTGAADVSNAVTKGVGIGELFHVSEFDRISLAELAGGATASITGAGAKTLGDVLKFAAVEGPTGDITRENLVKMADNVSTFSNFHKAWLVSQYGIYKSQKGTVLGADIPSEDALWFALGLGRPQEADTADYQMSYMDGKETVVKEAATQIRNWRQEAFSNPDKVDENANKQWTLLALYPPDVQRQIMKRTNNITDKSFYDRVQSKFDREANVTTEETN